MVDAEGDVLHQPGDSVEVPLAWQVRVGSEDARPQEFESARVRILRWMPFGAFGARSRWGVCLWPIVDPRRLDLAEARSSPGE